MILPINLGISAANMIRAFYKIVILQCTLGHILMRNPINAANMRRLSQEISYVQDMKI